MGKRSNFTPMNRFHEIIDHYGLKLMEVGVNHLRIFSPKDGNFLIIIRSG